MVRLLFNPPMIRRRLAPFNDADNVRTAPVQFKVKPQWIEKHWKLLGAFQPL
jgi:hypothetical protein